MLNGYYITEHKLWFDYWLHPLFIRTEKLDAIYFEQILTKAVELSPDITKHIYE